MRLTTKKFDATIKDSFDNEIRHRTLHGRINAKGSVGNGKRDEGVRADREIIELEKKFDEERKAKAKDACGKK